MCFCADCITTLRSYSFSISLFFFLLRALASQCFTCCFCLALLLRQGSQPKRVTVAVR